MYRVSELSERIVALELKLSPGPSATFLWSSFEEAMARLVVETGEEDPVVPEGDVAYWGGVYRFCEWYLEDVARWERIFGDLFDGPSMHWCECEEDTWGPWQPPTEEEARVQALELREVLYGA